MILVTGCASRFGRRLVETLLQDPGRERVLGIDHILPPAAPRAPGAPDPLARLDARRRSLEDPGLDDLLRAEGVTAIAHLLWAQEPLDRRIARRVNVEGARALARAAARAGVRRIVFKSSTSVYGASPRHPLFVKEEAALDGAPHDARAEHILEAESKLRAEASAAPPGAPPLTVGILRFAPILGAAAESRLSAYLRPRTVPTALGFDPRIQLVHEDDVVRSLAHALATGFAGTANVAAPGVLPLHRVLRLLGRASVPLPRPLLRPALALHALLHGRAHLRMSASALRTPPVGDLTRMRAELGYHPTHEAIDVVRAEAARIAAAAEPGSAEEALASREADIERDRLREAIRNEEARARGGAPHGE